MRKVEVLRDSAGGSMGQIMVSKDLEAEWESDHELEASVL